MKYVVIIPMYKRHDLTRLCFKHLKRQQLMFEFDVIIGGSEGEASKALADEFSYKYIEVPNRPLGRKFNLLMEAAKGYDGVVVLGSDDFLSDSAFERYAEIDINEPTIHGITKCHFFSTETKRLASLNFKNSLIQIVGAGRFYPASLLKHFDWKPWTDEKENGLDTDASLRLCTEEVNLEGVYLLDVKHTLNVTKKDIVKAGREENKAVMYKELGEDICQQIEIL